MSYCVLGSLPVPTTPRKQRKGGLITYRSWHSRVWQLLHVNQWRLDVMPLLSYFPAFFKSLAFRKPDRPDFFPRRLDDMPLLSYFPACLCSYAFRNPDGQDYRPWLKYAWINRLTRRPQIAGHFVPFLSICSWGLHCTDPPYSRFLLSSSPCPGRSTWPTLILSGHLHQIKLSLLLSTSIT